MSSAVKADSLEAALAVAIGRFDGPSPVTAQVHDHFGCARSGAPPHPRLRMQLVLEVVAEERGSPADALDVACAVEILHNSTLVHDAVEGGAAQFGLAHGINAGDALCAMAYLQLLEGPPRRTPEQTVLMTRALQAANFALCGGQAREIALAREGTIDAEAYVAMLAGKAALFAVACELGALVAGAGSERAAAYARLGRNYAMAFQVEEHVHADAASRTWTPPALASGATARAYFAQGDELATASGIDRSGRLRTFLTNCLRTAA